jgi:hypothetical protein
VDRNAISAAEGGENGRRDRVRLGRAPGLAHGGDVVDVHTETDHWRRLSLL